MIEDHPNRKWWTLFAMCFALFMIMLDNTVVNVALPSIQRALRTTPENLEWTINAYVLTFAGFILLGGKLGDRFGRKRLFLVGLTVFTASSAACALSSTDTQLIASRVVQGVGAAFLNPLSLSILVSAFPRKQLPTAIGIWAGISGLGLAIGPLLGGFLVQNVSWSAVFWINVPIGIVAFAVTIWAVIESRDPSAKHIDIVGTLLVTGGLFALTWGLIKTDSHSWTSPYIIGFLALAAVLLVGFVVWELRQSDPMIPLGFFRKPAFSISSLVVLMVGVAMFGVIYFITLYFQNIHGYSPQQAGLRSLPLTAMVVLVAPIAGRLNGRVGPRPLMTIGMAGMALGLLGLAQIGVDTNYLYLIPMFLVMGAGISMTMPSVTSAAMGSVDPTKAGIASGVVNSSRQVGGALGVAVFGSIAATLASDSWSSSISKLPAAAHAGAARLTPLVIGGQTAKIGHIATATSGAVAGKVASDDAAAAFMHGFHGAMYAGALMAAAASVTAFVGLRNVRVRQPQEQQAEQPMAAVEM